MRSYSLTFMLLAAEMASFCIFVAPLPSKVRRKLFRFLSESPIIAKVAYGLKISFMYVSPFPRDVTSENPICIDSSASCSWTPSNACFALIWKSKMQSLGGLVCKTYVRRLLTQPGNSSPYFVFTLLPQHADPHCLIKRSTQCLSHRLLPVPLACPYSDILHHSGSYPHQG